MKSKFISACDFYVKFSGLSMFWASLLLSVSRIMKVMIMIIPLQIILMLGSEKLPSRIANLMPKNTNLDISFLLALFVAAFVSLLVIYAFLKYKSATVRRKALDIVFARHASFIKDVYKGKQVFAKLMSIQSDILLKIICLAIICFFNVSYFCFCLVLILFGYYFFEVAFSHKKIKHVDFITEVYSLFVYILMIIYLAYYAYTSEGSLLHLVPIFFISRMIIVSIPRVLKDRLALKKCVPLT